ncbi:MAG: hypothetical protein P8Q23_04285 [Paracoccaceae bacterium]|nr:hypothetical protein [Paracoccaceae bacterium]
MQFRALMFMLLPFMGQSVLADETTLCYCPQGQMPEMIALNVDLELIEYDLESKSQEPGFEWVSDLYWQDPDIQRMVSIRTLEYYQEYLAKLANLPPEEQCMIADVVDTAWNPASDVIPGPTHQCP